MPAERSPAREATASREAPRPSKTRPAAQPRTASAWHWQRLVDKAISRHRWAMKGLALKWAKHGMPKALDTRRPRGLTIRGERWGWRELRSSW
eukprot:5896375-Lingulodinium_polyedra.AAC.1